MWELPWGLLCRTSGKRKLCMMPCHICHIYGIWRRGGGCLKSSFGRGNMQPTRGRDDFNGEGGLGFSLYVILLCWNFIATRYCKRFCWILPFPRFLLFHLLCIYWDWQDQKLKCPKVIEGNSELYWTVISASTYPRGIQPPLATTSQEYIYWKWKMKIKKIFYLDIREISTLQLYKVLFLMKLSADMW